MCACVGGGTGPLVFNGDETADISSRMNPEVHRDLLPAEIQSNASERIGQSFTVQRYNDHERNPEASQGIKTHKQAATAPPADCRQEVQRGVCDDAT